MNASTAAKWPALAIPKMGGRGGGAATESAVHLREILYSLLVLLDILVQRAEQPRLVDKRRRRHSQLAQPIFMSVSTNSACGTASIAIGGQNSATRALVHRATASPRSLAQRRRSSDSTTRLSGRLKRAQLTAEDIGLSGPSASSTPADRASLVHRSTCDYQSALGERPVSTTDRLVTAGATHLLVSLWGGERLKRAWSSLLALGPQAQACGCGFEWRIQGSTFARFF